MKEKVKEKIKEGWVDLKKSRTKGKEIQKLRTKSEKILMYIFLPIELIILIIMGVGLIYFSFIESSDDLSWEFMIFSLLLIIILIPPALITDIIDQRVKKRHKKQYFQTKLNHCKYCGRELDGFQNFCPVCGKPFDDKHLLMIQHNKLEPKKREKPLVLISEYQVGRKIITFNRKALFSSFMMISLIIVIIISLFPIFLFSFKDPSAIIGSFIVGMILFTSIGLFIVFGLTVAEFKISNEKIELIIENHPYFQEFWSNIKSIEIFKVKMVGYMLKFNSPNSFKIISLWDCGYPKGKQKKIIKLLADYSSILNKQISELKSSKTIIEEYSMELIRNEIKSFVKAYKFKRRQKNL
jgi:hypothetical protein